MQASADSPKAIAAGITMAVVGIAYFMASPVIVGALSEYSGFSEQQAGLLAAFEAGGSFVASILVSLLVNRLDRRRIAVLAILLAVVANLAMAVVDTFHATAVWRLLSGLGSGTLYALGLASLAASSQTSRNYSILLFVQVSFGMLEINLFGQLAQWAGMQGIYLFMASAFALCLLVLRYVPVSAGSSSAEQDDTATQQPLRLLPWLCLFAVFLFYSGTSAFWTYIERIGDAAGLSKALVTGALTYTQVLSLAGCVLAGWLSHRFGVSRPLIVSLICTALASYALTFEISNLSYVISLAVFFLFWNAIDIYQLASLGDMDHGGRLVALVPAFQTAATAAGPALGATLLAMNSGYASVLVMSGSTAVLAALLCMLAFSYRDRSLTAAAAPGT